MQSVVCKPQLVQGRCGAAGLKRQPRHKERDSAGGLCFESEHPAFADIAVVGGVQHSAPAIGDLRRRVPPTYSTLHHLHPPLDTPALQTKFDCI